MERLDKPPGVPQGDERERIPWHPAFIEALQLELDAYHDVLEFFPEFRLTSEPLRIDCVVIKKNKGAVIKKTSPPFSGTVIW